MKTLILSIMFGFVFFTTAVLLTTPSKAITVSHGELQGDISDFCIQARMDAIDLRASGIRDNYNQNLVKTCGELN